MKKYLIYWKRNDGMIFTTYEEAENLRKAMKQIAYFEKKTKYEVVGIREEEDEA